MTTAHHFLSLIFREKKKQECHKEKRVHGRNPTIERHSLYYSCTLVLSIEIDTCLLPLH